MICIQASIEMPWKNIYQLGFQAHLNLGKSMYRKYTRLATKKMIRFFILLFSFFLSVYLSILYMNVIQFVCLSTCPLSTHWSVCLYIYLCICKYASLSVCLSVYLSVIISVCMYVSLSVCLYICMYA